MAAKRDSTLELTREEKELLVQKFKDFFDEEWEMEIGNLKAQFLLDFICETMGPLFYNRGIEDAARLMTIRVEDLYALTK